MTNKDTVDKNCVRVDESLLGVAYSTPVEDCFVAPRWSRACHLWSGVVDRDEVGLLGLFITSATSNYDNGNFVLCRST